MERPIGLQDSKCNFSFQRRDDQFLRKGQRMRAVQVRSTGGPEVLELRTLPDPVPQAGEVLVRVHTSGVNFIDVYTNIYSQKTAFADNIGQQLKVFAQF